MWNNLFTKNSVSPKIRTQPKKWTYKEFMKLWRSKLIGLFKSVLMIRNDCLSLVENIFYDFNSFHSGSGSLSLQLSDFWPNVN